MAEHSNIEWTDATFNPWIGCTKVGPGCDHCYAETLMDTRMGKAKWGPGNPRSRTSKQNWNQPLRWNRLAGMGRFVQCDDCGRREFRKWDASLPPGGLSGCSTPGCVALPESDSSPARPRVFCASLADWLDNEVPVEWLVDLFDIIRQTPNLDWLLLSKRIGNWRPRLELAAFHLRHDISRNDRMQATLEWIQDWLDGDAPANVWLGATVVNQAEADRDIPKLLATPAEVRFLSIEPLLGPIDIYNGDPDPRLGDYDHGISALGEWWEPGDNLQGPPRRGVDWVIVGGESGRHARPMRPEWVRSLRDQCWASDTPLFFKQWGEWAPNWDNDDSGNKIPGSEWMDRMGKKSAGRLLDGREWNQIPEPRQT